MGRKAVSSPVAAIVAAVVAISIAAIAVAIFAQRAQTFQAGLQEAGGIAAREIRTRLSLVYHIGDEIMISNDGNIPAKIAKIFIDGNEFHVSYTIDPGEKWVYTNGRLRGARNIAVGLEGGGIVVIKTGGG